MKKRINYNIEYFHVVDLEKKKNVPKEFRDAVDLGIRAAQDFLGIKVKPKIFYSNSPSKYFAECLNNRRPIFVFFLKSFEGHDETEIIKTAIHEYAHLYFHKNKLTRAFTLSEEEEIVSRIERKIWQEYF
jgi:hypothetical protein